MTTTQISQYTVFNHTNLLLRSWSIQLLDRIDLHKAFLFSTNDSHLFRLLDTTSLTKEIMEEATLLNNWITVQRKSIGFVCFNENDVFCINTRHTQTALDLNDAELSVLRFALILASCKPFRELANSVNNDLGELETCLMISDLMGHKVEHVYDALSSNGKLQKSGLLDIGCPWDSSGSLEMWLSVPKIFVKQAFRCQEENTLTAHLPYMNTPKTKLISKDFKELKQDMDLVKNYLKFAIDRGEHGANVLLHGEPGTGKTEFARYLVKSLKKNGLEIKSLDSDGDAMCASTRLNAYLFCQSFKAKERCSIVIYDEVEELLSDSIFADRGFHSSESSVTKGLINSILETNKIPTIWITNTLRGVDHAYLRRFDIVLNIKKPTPQTRERIARKLLCKLPFDRELINAIADHSAITPAHLAKASRIAIKLGGDNKQANRDIVKQILNYELAATDEKPLKRIIERSKDTFKMDYQPDLINCDTQLSQLTENLNDSSSARLCLFGPPGTGKTAWAHHLAKSQNRPLIVKSSADIADKYIGETEKNIESAFEEATDTDGILLFDEVDSFLQNRSNTSNHWEITQVNQFLTSMETYKGILVCTTNLVDDLDPATMRRFDFKVNFDYLTDKQTILLTANLLKGLNVQLTKNVKTLLVHKLRGLKLSHGDFAVILRRYSVLKTKPNVTSVINDLRHEAGFRSDQQHRGIGFLASS